MFLKTNLVRLASFLDIIFASKIIPSCIFLVFLCYHFFRIPVSLAGVDSGYFLSIARDLQEEGLVPLRDIHSGYTPIGYWIYAIPFALFEKSNIIHFYYFNLFLVLIATLLFFFIVKNINFKYTFWIILVFFLNTSFLIYDIKLELVALIPTLLAFFFVLKYLQTLKLQNLIASGLFIGMAVLTKQYALLLIPMAIILAFQDAFKEAHKNRHGIFQISTAISSGVLIVFIFFIFVYIILNKVDPAYLLSQFLGTFAYDCTESYGHRSIVKMLLGFKYYAIFMPYVFFVPILFFGKVSKSEKRTIFSFIILIAISLLPYYFQIYPHYFFFGFVPVFLAGTLIIQRSRFSLLLFTVSMFPVLYNLYSVYSFTRDYKFLQTKKKDEVEFYAQVSNIIPAGVPAYVIGKNQIYFECNLKAIDTKNLSYGFVPPSCIEKYLSISTNRPNIFYYVGPGDKISFGGYTQELIHATTDIKGYRQYFILKFIAQ